MGRTSYLVSDVLCLNSYAGENATKYAAEMKEEKGYDVDRRIDGDLLIMARTDFLSVFSLEDAIERANRYWEAGADPLFVEAPTSKEEMIRINHEINAPTMAIQIEQGRTAILTTTELEEIGFNTVVYPGTSFLLPLLQ